MNAEAPRFTLDTNILFYSVDADAGARHATASEIVATARNRDCWLTLQAVSEFYAAVTRKGKVPPIEAAAQCNDWLELFPALAASPSALRAALSASAGGRASFWDAILLATAAEGGCQTVLTEDMQNGSDMLGVRVVNPFNADGSLSAAAAELLRAGR